MGQVSPDGERVATVASAPDNAARIWQVPVPSSKIPDWLAALAEGVAGMAVGSQGTTQVVSERDFDQVKQCLNGLPGDDNFSRLARWFFSDRATRTISPFQPETVAEYVNRRIQENTRASLEEAVRLDPANALALARLARMIRQTDSSPRSLSDAAQLARRALRFDPDQRVAREILTQTQP
jgi:hypothetical protein